MSSIVECRAKGGWSMRVRENACDS
uniref:SRCR domain-containing protein n=1 Tax=Steinernema glaseri TaxID=37863 RepID=A0A1I7ZDK5_9BILA